MLDPSRIAAQLVSGIGFIGGGLIFVRKDTVRGLTTAATVWLTAAVGMACGAGFPILAIAVYFWPFRCGLRVSLYRAPAAKIPLGPVVAAEFPVRTARAASLREVLASCTRSEFARVAECKSNREPSHEELAPARVARQETLSAENVLGGDWAPPPKGIK